MRKSLGHDGRCCRQMRALCGMEVWTLDGEPPVRPILVVGYNFVDPHEVDQSTAPLPFCAASPNDVSAEGNSLANFRFARCERAHTKKRIWRKPVVVIEHVGVELH